jgi:hypothetical protein
MLRKGKGDYHDRFCNVGYRVWRDRVDVWGRVETGWRFQVDGLLCSGLYDRKESAAQAARREIYDTIKS